MTVGELVKVLRSVDQNRLVYVVDVHGGAELVSAAVALQHVNVPTEFRVSIPDDIILLPASMLE